MFEDENFELDEDSLKDIAAKEDEYYSQEIKLDGPNETPAKRQRVELLDCDYLVDVIFDDESEFPECMPKPIGTVEKAYEPRRVDSSPKKKTPKISGATNDSSCNGITSMKLCRRFPGPAGLSPVSPGQNFDWKAFYGQLEFLAKNKNLDVLKFFENTETVFGNEVWPLMIADLPPNFLKGHEIATTIKNRTGNSRVFLHAPIIAGVVDEIDMGLDNPRLILRDTSCSINATLHYKIKQAHLNVLRPGIIMLLRDIAVPSFLGGPDCPGIRYHLIICPKNIMAIYSEKGRVVSSPWIESLKKSADSSRRVIRPVDFRNDEFDDTSLLKSLDLDDVENSQAAPSTSISKTLPKITSDLITMTEEKKSESKQMKKLVVGNNVRTAVASIEKSRKTIATASSNDSKLDYPKDPNERCLSVVAVETRPKIMSNIKLRVGKSTSEKVSSAIVLATKTVEIPSLAIDDKFSKDNGGDGVVRHSIAETSGNVLPAIDNDTDDEILSQLDIESIVANYNKES